MTQPLTTFGLAVLMLLLIATTLAITCLSIQSLPPTLPLSSFVPTPVSMTPPRELVAPDDDYVQKRLLFYAIAQAEGWRDVDTPGPKGERGKYQVTPIWWEDCNRITGEDLPFTAFYYTQEELVESRMLYYWFYYGGKTDEEKMALHVAGPTGITKMKTSKEIQDYIKRVKSYLPKEK